MLEENKTTKSPTESTSAKPACRQGRATEDKKKTDVKAVEVSNDKSSDKKEPSNQRTSKFGGNRKFDGKRKRTGGRRDQREKDEFEQKIVHIARVTRVMKGGKRMRFRACVAIGDKKGRVAIGLSKSADVTEAISKAVSQAKKNIVNVQIINGTIAHDLNYKLGAARIMMKPAKQGSGIIAGGAMRIILELVGINSIVGKIQGSNNKVNIVKCVVAALDSLKKIDVPQDNKKKDSEKKEDNKIKESK